MTKIHTVYTDIMLSQHTHINAGFSRLVETTDLRIYLQHLARRNLFTTTAISVPLVIKKKLYTSPLYTSYITIYAI
jgi:hypothetical protein